MPPVANIRCLIKGLCHLSGIVFRSVLVIQEILIAQKRLKVFLKARIVFSVIKGEKDQILPFCQLKQLLQIIVILPHVSIIVIIFILLNIFIF